MLEPTFLSVPELADRWKQTERQILEHGAAMRLPLYFMFDGVAIPINDRWHLSHGHEYQDALRERESLEHSISLARGELARNAAILRGHSEPSPYEDMPLSTERKNALVARIEAEEAKLEAVTLRLEKRERTRRRYECNGILRIMPGAAKAIMIEGKAFVDRAYLPGKPLTLRQEQGGFILDGPILALEGGRVRLSQGDLLASLAEVKAIEGKTDRPSLDMRAKETAHSVPEWRLARRKRMDALTAMIYPLLEKARVNGQPIPKAREVIGELDATRPPGCHGLGDGELKYEDDRGEIQTVNVTAIQKRIDRLIERPEGH